MIGRALLAALACLVAVSRPCWAAPDATSVAQCLNDASSSFALTPELLWAIKRVETGAAMGAVVARNTNGTTDVGWMQINSVWYPQLRSMGIDPDLLDDPCLNMHVGAWILSAQIQRYGVLHGIAHYHSANPRRGLAYADRVITEWSALMSSSGAD